MILSHAGVGIVTFDYSLKGGSFISQTFIKVEPNKVKWVVEFFQTGIYSFPYLELSTEELILPCNLLNIFLFLKIQKIHGNSRKRSPETRESVIWK